MTPFSARGPPEVTAVLHSLTPSGMSGGMLSFPPTLFYLRKTTPWRIGDALRFSAVRSVYYDPYTIRGSHNVSSGTYVMIPSTISSRIRNGRMPRITSPTGASEMVDST
jgi:hypothetical protein